MSEWNPYAPPVAAVHDIADVPAPSGDDVLVRNGRRRPAHEGLEWIATSWGLFKERPGTWILAVVLAYGTTILLSLIPWVNVAVAAAGPALTAGFAAMGHAAHRRQRVRLGQLLTGFQQRPGPLLLVGVGYLVLWSVCVGVLVLLDGPAWIRIATGAAGPELLEGRLLVLLAYSMTMMVVAMSIAFAPALVLLNEVPPFAAMRMSLTGGLKNVLPGLVCALTYLPILFVSVLPLGLGLLVTLPLIVLSIYAAYRSIFLESAPDA